MWSIREVVGTGKRTTILANCGERGRKYCVKNEPFLRQLNSQASWNRANCASVIDGILDTHAQRVGKSYESEFP